MRPRFAAFFFSLVLLSAFGCSKPSDTVTSAPPTCEDRLKTKMLKGDFEFVDVENPELKALIQNSNEVLNGGTAHDVSYVTTYSNAKHTKISNLNLSAEVKIKSGEDLSVSIDLGPPPAFSRFIYSLSISVSRGDTDSNKISLGQTLNVTSECTFFLTSTSKKEESLSNQTARLRRLVVDGKGDRPGSTHLSERSVPIPANVKTKIQFGDVQSTADLKQAVENLQGQAYAIPWIADDPLILLTMTWNKDLRYVETTKSGAQKVYHPIVYQIKHPDGSLVMTMELYYSDDQSHFTKMGTNEKWPSTRDEFLSSHIFTGSDLEGELDKSAIGRKGVIRFDVSSNQELRYPNLSTYWNLEKKLDDKDDDLNLRYVAHPKDIDTSQADPLIENPQTLNVPDLNESKAVQISLPRIQAMIAELKKHEGLNRLQMVDEILAMIKKTIQYDYSAMEDSTVNLLSVEDILNRGKGVCQHFAVLFTTLARGVGIPTRIIMGYAVDVGPFVNHAWNEIELRKGVWIPIDPQNSNHEFSTQYYLPWMVGTIFETMAVSQADANEIFKRDQFKIHVKFFRD